MISKFLSAIFLLAAISQNSFAKEYNHGYIGKLQFDITESRFNLFDTGSKCKYQFNDIHFHPRDFTMHGSSLSEIWQNSNQNCVDKILLNSLPLLEHWSDSAKKRPTYYTDDKSKFYWNTISDIPTFEEYRHLAPEQKSKYFFLVNGFMHFDLGAIEAVKSTLELYGDLPIVGFGEIFGEHDIMSDQMNPPSKINSKALDPIYELAAQKHWFVLIHNNISNRSFRGPTEPIYQDDIEAVLEKHRNTTFVWAHSGIMRNIVINDITPIIDKMLAKNENLYIDISFVVLENYIMAEGKPNKKWIDLIEKYPNRFLFGTDDLGGYQQFYDVKKYLPLLSALKSETAKKLASKNFDYLIEKSLKK